MYQVVIIGGGWSGCAAALSARKAGAEVVLLEKTDLLLGLGNVGGIMRNNGRFTAAEENIALGAGELFAITDECARHQNIDFPGHRHASLYDVTKVEPCVRRLLQEYGIQIRMMARAVDVVTKKSFATMDESQETIIEKVILAGGEEIEGDVFVEATGSTGPNHQVLNRDQPEAEGIYLSVQGQQKILDHQATRLGQGAAAHEDRRRVYQ